MITRSAAPVLVVLLPGPDPRVLGGSARGRNMRVAARAGAEIVNLAALAGHGNSPALIVPPQLLINLGLFVETGPTATAVPTWIEAGPGTAVLAGPAAAVAAYVDRSGAGKSVRHGQAEPIAPVGPNAPDGRESLTKQGTTGWLGVPDAGIELPRQQVPADALLNVSTPALRRRAVWRILQRTAKPTDGWVSRHCNRPISRAVSFVALSFGLTASHASLLTLAVGLATAALALRPGYLTLIGTGILFQLASVLDGVDGEMARATLTESEAGARLDAIVDQLTYVACFVGVTIGWAREGGAGPALFWTAAIALALVLSLVRGGRFVSRHAPDASFVFIDRAVRRAARDSNLIALRVAAGGFALLRRDLFAIVFLGVSFLGRRALIPALVGAGVLLANVTLSVYRHELAAAAVLERG